MIFYRKVGGKDLYDDLFKIGLIAFEDPAGYLFKAVFRFNFARNARFTSQMSVTVQVPLRLSPRTAKYVVHLRINSYP